MSHIVVIGAGAWGSALAQSSAVAGNDVSLIGRSQTTVDEINSAHTNSKYLGKRALSDKITASCDLGILAQADLVVLAVPAQTTRLVIKGLSARLKRAVPVVLTAKGFEHDSLALQADIVTKEWPKAKIIVLSGPSFAVDVAANLPTAVTLAGKDDVSLNWVAAELSSKYMRPYLSDDPLGVALCGGLKNIYALGSGAIEGANLGFSARSAFVARGLSEMGRLIAGMKGNSASVLGLAGVGDLMLTCTSAQSRNYRFGIELGKGKTVRQILAMGLGLAEGVASAPAAAAIAKKANVDAPLVFAVNALLNNELSVAQIVEHLMLRDLTSDVAQ